MYARSYLDTQQLRIAVGARLRKLKEYAVIKEYGKLTGQEDHSLTALLKEAKRTERKTLLSMWEKKLKEEGILEEAMRQVEGDEVYEKLEAHSARLSIEEKTLLKEAKTLYKTHELWNYCERVKGLGPVAAMTFLGYINPYVVKTAGQMNAYLGLIPNMKRVAGERSKFNPEIKGRFRGVIVKNVIMARDPYYSALIKAKKEYLANRPDLAAKKLTEKGWKGHINNMALRWLTQILISHAIEVIRRSENLEVYPRRNYIPVKPTDPFTTQQVLKQILPVIKQGGEPRALAS